MTVIKKWTFKTLKWLGYGVGTIVVLVGVTYVGGRIYSPPYQDQITPDKVDLMASGTPAMPLPLGKLETYEPHITINPNNPDHMIVAAMYGNRGARAGDYLYRWRTMNGGKTWTHETMPTYAHPGKFVADVVTGIHADGIEHYISMYSDSKVPDDSAAVFLFMLPLHWSLYYDRIMGRPADLKKESEEGKNSGVSMLRADAITGKFEKPVAVSLDKTGPSDKTWLAIDTSEKSPFKGNVYGAWSIFPPHANPDSIVFVASRDGGKTYSKPVKIMEPGYGAIISTRPDGVVDVIGRNEVTNEIMHIFSTDGGESFSKPAVLSGPANKSILRDLPSMAAAPDGTVLACWVESNDKDVQTRVKCASKNGTAAWTKAVDIAPNLPLTTKIGIPAVAANDSGLWVLAYKGDAKTEVVLYRSTDQGRSFLLYQTLASRKFGRDDLCIGSAHDTACRFLPITRTFLPGDYVGLAATGNRVAAAFVMPRGNVPYMFANTYTKIIDVPTKTGSEK